MGWHAPMTYLTLRSGSGFCSRGRPSATIKKAVMHLFCRGQRRSIGAAAATLIKGCVWIVIVEHHGPDRNSPWI